MDKQEAFTREQRLQKELERAHTLSKTLADSYSKLEAESGEEHKRLAEAVGQAEQARSLEAKKWEQDMKEREERLKEERAQL